MSLRRLAFASSLVAASLAVPLLPRALAWVEVSVLLRSAKEHLAAREYPPAREDLGRLLREHGASEAADEAALLIARSHLLEGQAEQALATSRAFQTERPRSPLLAQARYLEAAALSRLRRPGEAATVLEARLLALSAPERRGALSALYLALADEAYSPPPGTEPDFGRARDAYARALELGAPAARADEATFRLADCRLRLGQVAEAAAGLRSHREAFPRSALLGRGYLLEAQARARLSDLEGARTLLRQAEAALPGASEAALAIEALGDSYQPEATASEEARRLGVEHYERLLARFPAHERAPHVLLKVARSHRAAGRHEPAVAALRTFVERFATSPEVGEARYLIGASLLAMTRFDAGRGALGAFLGAHPSHARFVPAQEAIAVSWIDQGQAAADASRRDEAVAAWRAFLAGYPVHARAAEVQRRLGDLFAAASAWPDALAEWRSVVERFPATAEGARAQLQVARACEGPLSDLAAATREYERLLERFAGWPEAYAARAALATLREKHLRLVTPHASTVREGARVSVALRNVPRLELKAYRIDLVDYFERKHHVGSVEELAVDIVRPDATWTFEVEGYEPFRLYEREVALPVQGAGAWVLVAEEDELRATTLVVCSDVTTILKRAPGQLLVFAQDEATLGAAAGVDVLVSNGREVIHRGRTGPDGLLVLEAPSLGAGTRVLAHRGGSVAFDAGAPGSRGAFGYATRCFAFTDRPVYRPGDTVRWKAWLRRVEAGAYVARGGEEARVVVSDSRGVALFDARLRTGPLGGLEGEVELGSEAAIGDYTVRLEYAQGAGTCTFAVEAYRKPEVLVELVAERSDTLTGEPVTLRGAVRTYYGGVVAAAPVTWSVMRRPAPFDASLHRGYAWFFQAPRDEEDAHPWQPVAQGTAQSDADGRFQVAFTPEAADLDMLYAVSVSARGPEGRPVAGGASVFVTTRGFYALVEAESRVVRPGQPLRVLVETVDARHAGVTAQGELQAVRRGGPQGLAEEVTDRAQVTTDAAGRAEVVLRIARPGDYVLRFVGRDRRGGAVEGGAQVVVEGVADDAARVARVRADREVYRRGDTARLLLDTPCPGRLALLTVEGERVLFHRVVALRERSQSLELPMSDAFSPNAVVRLAVAEPGALHEGEDQVLVFKYLDLQVTVDRAEHRPGDEVTLEVLARDQTGNPVAAEVALAVVDEAVFAVRADGTPGIKPFFYDQRRQNAVTTGSSARWRYEGTTVRQVADVLAEREQRELEEVLRSAAADRIAELARDMPAPTPPPPAPPGGPMEPPAAGGEGGGRGRNFRFGGADADDGLVAEAEEGAALQSGQPSEPARRRFADTAFWAPSVVTGADGRGRVTFRLPDDLTTWRVTARGATSETLVGDARASFRTQKDLVARLSLPRVVTEQDAFTISVVADNRTAEALHVTASLLVEGPPPAPPAHGGSSTASATPFDLAARTARAVEFQAGGSGPLAGPITYTARVAAGGRQDAVVQTLPVVPVGVPERSATSGALEAVHVANLELAQDVVPGTAELELRISPSPLAALADGLGYLGACPHASVELAASRIVSLAAGRAVLEPAGMPRADLDGLRRALERAVRALLDLQRPDGSFGWWREDAAQAGLTAHALLGLTVAHNAGTFVDAAALQRARAAARRLLRGVGEDHDARAALCYALAAGGDRELGDDLNRLARARQALSSRALAQLVLVRQEQREGSLQELVAELERRAVRTADGASFPAPEVRPAGRDRSARAGPDVETTAWAGLALLATRTAADGLVADVARWLRARQAADGSWRSSRETAAVLLFLATHVRGARADDVDLQVEVSLNGERVTSTRLRSLEGQRVVRVRSDRLRPGRNELRVSRRGTGEIRFMARLSWVRRVAQLDASGTVLRVQRDLVAWDDPGRTRAFPQHGSILRAPQGTTFEPGALDTAVLGDRVWVRVRLDATEPLPFAVVTVPLPGGVEVVAGRTQGRLDRLEARDGAATLYLSQVAQGRTEVAFLVQAVTAGRFVALPATAELVYEPEVFGRSAGATLTVRRDPDPSRPPTPDERLIAARGLLAAGRFAEARPALEALRALELVQEAREEVLLGLLVVGLRTDDPALAVRSFEALRDEAPRAVTRLALDLRRDLAIAYRRAGEGERSCALAHEVLLGLLREEAGLAETYRRLGRPIVAADFLRRTLLDYPDDDAVVEGWFQLAQGYLQIPLPPERRGPRLRHAPQDTQAEVMLEEAFRALRDFCAYFPDSPRAPEAHARAADALARLGDRQGVAAEGATFAARYREHRLLDDVLVLRLRALAALERWDDAFACGRTLLDYQETVGQRRVPSPFRDEVLHTFARIHHQRGEIAQAVSFYGQVRDRIPDARDAFQYFTALDLQLADVVTAAPGQSVALSVRSKNVERLSLKVYPVDLMILFLTRKSLVGIHDIDLTGIPAVHETEVPLGRRDEYAWRTTSVPLPLGGAAGGTPAGVYLVVAKAGDLHRTSIVVVSDLRLEVQRAQARVRVYATTRDGRPAAGARVRITDGQRLVGRGDTDARGVLEVEAQVAEGTLSVVVEREGHYALFREGE